MTPSKLKIAKFAFSLFGINTYVVYDPSTRKAAVIDPGMINEEEYNALTGFITRNNLTVTHIINTHLHIDHAIADAYAARVFHAPIFAHKDDEFLGGLMRTQASSFGIHEKIEDMSVNSYLTDGEKIRIGDGELTVLHVPGHSPGSIALYCRESGFVIAGDALFAGSVGRTDLPGGDMNTLINAIRAKLLTLPDETVVFSGHGPETTIGDERRTNPFLRP